MDISLSFREKSPEYFVLDFEDFRKEVMTDLKEVCGPEYLVEKRDVIKNNGITLYGISITGSGETVFPTIYLESFYDEYRKGNLNVKETVNEILRVYSREKRTKGIDMYYLTEFEKVRDKLIFRLVNAEKNEELLKNVPHRRFLDLAVIYTVFIDDVFTTAGNVTVRNDLMEQWGVDERTLYELAAVNTPRIKTPVVKELGEMLCELIAGCGEGPLSDELYETGGIRMFVLTNSDRYYGDSIILYPGVLRDLKISIKSDLYLLPSSVHEFIIVPDCGNIGKKELTELVKSVNESAVGAEDFLSDNVYLYSNDEIQIC